MERWLRRSLLSVCVLMAVVAAAGATYQCKATRDDLAITPPPGRLVDVGGHRLHLWCTGDGTPAVILESGLGGSTAGWGFIQPEVAKFTAVCSYDRAGMGYSDPGPTPRTARRMAGELGKLLDHTGMRSPVILVAASVGGFIVRILASERRDRVAGLVLVDASHEDQRHDIPHVAHFVPLLSSLGIFRALGVSFDLPPASLAPSVRPIVYATRFRSAGQRAAADEIMHIHESAAEVRDSRRTLTMPLIVVSGALGADATWQKLQRDQVRLSEHGCQIVADQSGHVVGIDQPRVVVDAIRSVVDAVRNGSSAARCAE